MGVRRSISLIIFALAVVFPVSAATVSILVAEIGLQGDGPIAEFSRVWENNLMDGFFEGGHIISNAPILRLRGGAGAEFPEEARAELNNALAGGADFLVLVLLDYEGHTDKTAPKPLRMFLRLFKVSPYRFLFEQRYAGEFPNTKQVADLLVSRLRG